MKNLLISLVAVAGLTAPAFAQDTGGDKAHKSGGKMKATEKKKDSKKPEGEKKPE